MESPPRPDKRNARGPGSGRDKANRRRDAAFVLPAFGALVLLPPFLNLFNRGVLVFGIPLEVAYLFTVWMVLVLGALAMAGRPGQGGGQGDGPNGGPENGGR